MGDSRGQQYDTAMRRLVEGDPGSMCRLLDVPVEGTAQPLPASFPSTTVAVDLLLRTGPGRLAHVEYQRVGETGFAARMLLYRALIMRRHPGEHLTQHVVVLGDRRITGHDDFDVHGFRLRLGVLYLRERDPEEFLGDPSLAPLAALARGTPEERRVALRRAFRLIRAQAGARATELEELATTLATIRLARPTIDLIAEREAAVAWASIGEEILSNTTPARRMRQIMLEKLLHGRFRGDTRDMSELAGRLVEWNDDDAAVTAILDAGSPDEVLARRPAS